MARELRQSNFTGRTVYSFLFLADASVDNGKVWNDTTKQWGIPAAASLTDFQLVHTEDPGTGIYTRDLPAELVQDRNYEAFGFDREGATPNPAADVYLDRQILTAPQNLAAAFKVDDSRTWIVRAGVGGYVGDAVLPAQSTINAVFACDFSRVLNPATGISSVSSVTEQGTPTLSISELAVSQDRSAAYFRLSSMTDQTTPRLNVVVLTTDSQVLTADCVLRVEDSP